MPPLQLPHYHCHAAPASCVMTNPLLLAFMLPAQHVHTGGLSTSQPPPNPPLLSFSHIHSVSLSLSLSLSASSRSLSLSLCLLAHIVFHLSCERMLSYTVILGQGGVDIFYHRPSALGKG